MEKAIYTNIQRYSIHDGPGLRTILFLKGCPLSCLWCSNPETQRRERELMYSPVQCIACGNCVEACRYDAFTWEPAPEEGSAQAAAAGTKPVPDKSKCRNCGACAEACPTGAASMAGSEITVEEAADLLEADSIFFRRSGGGITVSGGEPSQYPAFTSALLKELKKRGMHTALETCGFAPWDNLKETVRYADLILFDLKIADPEKHKAAAGTDNAVILTNAVRLAAEAEKGNHELIFRVPVIPAYTADTENLRKIAEFVCSLEGNFPVHLLPYHSFGSSKYRGIGKTYALSGWSPPGDDEMRELLKIFTDQGLEAKVV